ncbi:MAG: triose-phosphate isomerase [Pirellulaceae bacterium]|nr:triose-phosphate isomerase [Pirellulaceae bacterium]
MRPILIAGNWKMNLSRQQAIGLVEELLLQVDHFEAEVAICPPYVYLDTISQKIGHTSLALGGQDVYFENAGAFTGEISCEMLADLGCQYVILGHSERRHILGETNAIVNKKAFAALEKGLKPIVCVGETLKQREENQTTDIVLEQLYGSLAGITEKQAEQIVIAYEPVWAIGTGKVASPEQAEEVHATIRQTLATKFGKVTAQNIQILYGGSVKPENSKELIEQENIDGALVGGASLKAETFLGILDRLQ